MRCKLKSRPKLRGSLSEPVYMEFIILGVLAVLISIAIVIFLAKKTNIQPIAKAGSVAIQKDTPTSVTIAGGDEDGDQPDYSMAAGPTQEQRSEAAPNLSDNSQANARSSDSASVKVNDVKPDGEVESATDSIALKTYNLNVSAVDGTVKKSPDKTNYNHGETVTLQAIPNQGYGFTNWSGALSGESNPATLVMDADKSVSAGFAPKTYGLTVNAADGTVKKSPDKTSYNHGETVTLEAVPNKDYSFANWSGSLSGNTNPATLVVDGNKSITAGFSLKVHSLIVSAADGSIVKSPNKTNYNHGEAVTLEAVPNAGYDFSNWTGDLSGNTNPITLVIEADKSVIAGFALKAYSLIVSAADGSIKRSPDQAAYNHGEVVTLKAVPNTGYDFSNWTGDLSGNTNPVTLVMDGDKSVGAGFALKTYSLTVTAGDGFVMKSPPRASYNRGQTVTLRAVPNTGYSFTNWSGDLSGSTNPATLVMDADKSLAASFTLTAQASDVIINSVGMKLIYVPAGSFMMGSSSSAAQLAEQFSEGRGRFEDEFPEHPVRISKGFWMGQTEVTQSQYISVMNARPWSEKAYVQEDANNPAVYVSWDDAMEFCRNLTRQEGRTYRLPTEAEWEYACRAGTATQFSFGDSDLALGDYAWFNDNADKVGQDYAHPVGQKKPNPWGIYDMHGNVFEWCSDYYDEKYYSISPGVDPNGPAFGTSHSLRGGSWDNGQSYLRCSYRSDYPVSRGLLVGFRVVSDGAAVSDIAVVPREVESVIDRLKASRDSLKVPQDVPTTVRVQEDTPIAVKAPQDVPVVVKPQETASIPVKPQENVPITMKVPQDVPVAAKPQEDVPAAVKAREDSPPTAKVQAMAPPTTSTDSSLIYASGNVNDILDQAAVDARNGNVEQAQAALSSLLKDKDAAVMAGYEFGLIHYENGAVDKAMPLFKNAMSSAFPGPASGKDEQALNALLNQEADAARIRYELGLIYQSQAKQDQAAKLFRDGLGIISSKDATYIGVKKCKSCHFKQWNSWRKTKMANTFEVLKPGVRSEEKIKLKFDPNKDYTKDATCLDCHASGFGIPGGYVVPADGDAAAQEQADDNAGVTCEGCHGPGSKSVEIQEDIKENKRPYKFAELRAVGFHKAGVRSCTSCHNARDPGKEPGYHFEYEERRKEGQHENIELKYRQD